MEKKIVELIKTIQSLWKTEIIIKKNHLEIKYGQQNIYRKNLHKEGEKLC